MTGWTYIRWWHYLIPGKVARLRAHNTTYMKANSFDTYRAHREHQT